VVGGCVSYQAALHLMRTGAAGVLVGAGSGRRGDYIIRGCAPPVRVLRREQGNWAAAVYNAVSV